MRNRRQRLTEWTIFLAATIILLAVSLAISWHVKLWLAPSAGRGLFLQNRTTATDGTVVRVHEGLGPPALLSRSRICRYVQPMSALP